MKKFIFIALCFVVQWANTQTIIEYRQIRLCAMDVFDNYRGTFSNLDAPDRYVKDNFLSLFSDSAVIYNDILPDNSPQELSPEEYYDTYIRLIKSYAKFSNMELGKLYKRHDKWLIQVSFTKSFSLRYKHHDLSYPEYSLDYEMLVEMDKNPHYEKKATYSNREIEEKVHNPFINEKIREIRVVEPLQEYFVIQLDDTKLPKELQGLYDNSTGERIQIADKQNRALFDANKINKNDIEVNPTIDRTDYKILKQQDVFDSHYYRYSVTPVSNFVGITGSPILPLYGKDGKLQSSLSWGGSLVYGRLLRSFGTNKVYVVSRLGYSSLKFNETFDTISVRDTAVLSLKSTDVRHTFDVSLGVSVHKSIKSATLTFDLGLWGNCYGKSSNLDDSLLDTNFIVNELKYKSKFSPNKINGGMYAAIGILSPLKNNWYVKADVEFRCGFFKENIYQEAQVDIQTIGNSSFHSIHQQHTKWHRNNARLNIGIIRKF
jgi:hypothetical protein